jgi:YgiT-type zinc finger domain-containing protein
MIWCRPIRDRRGARRPANGDRKVCPQCGGETLEFSERYRIADRDGVIARTPAWVCDRTGCDVRLPVRRKPGAGLPSPRPTPARAGLPFTLRKKAL